MIYLTLDSKVLLRLLTISRFCGRDARFSRRRDRDKTRSQYIFGHDDQSQIVELVLPIISTTALIAPRRFIDRIPTAIVLSRQITNDIF